MIFLGNGSAMLNYGVVVKKAHRALKQHKEYGPDKSPSMYAKHG